jgi:ankyrin repeat protein
MLEVTCPEEFHGTVLRRSKDGIVRIKSILAGSPASHTKLKEGMVLVSVDDYVLTLPTDRERWAEIAEELMTPGKNVRLRFSSEDVAGEKEPEYNNIQIQTKTKSNSSSSSSSNTTATPVSPPLLAHTSKDSDDDSYNSDDDDKSENIDGSAEESTSSYLNLIKEAASGDLPMENVKDSLTSTSIHVKSSNSDSSGNLNTNIGEDSMIKALQSRLRKGSSGCADGRLDGEAVLKVGPVNVIKKGMISSKYYPHLMVLTSTFLVIFMDPNQTNKGKGELSINDDTPLDIEAIYSLTSLKLDGSKGHLDGLLSMPIMSQAEAAAICNGGMGENDTGPEAIDLSYDSLPTSNGGRFTYACKSIAANLDWTANIYGRMLEITPPDMRTLGWRHNGVEGTLFTTILRGTPQQGSTLIDRVLARDPMALDMPDGDGFTPLHYACILRRVPLVRHLHMAGADVTCTDRYTLTPIHWAALLHDGDTLNLLCERIFDPDIEECHGLTPLFLACVEGRADNGCMDYDALRQILNTLHSMDANLCLRDAYGRAAIHYACSRWDFDCTNFLGNLSLASIGKQKEKDEEKQRERDSKDTWNSRDEDESNINTEQSQYGNNDVEITLESALVMRCSLHGLTPLHYICMGKAIRASYGDHTSSTASLATHGHDQGLGDHLRNRVMESMGDPATSIILDQHAATHDSSNVGEAIRLVNYLLIHGAPVNARDGYGRTPLQLLAENSEKFGEALGPLITLLVSSGGRLETQSDKHRNEVDIDGPLSPDSQGKTTDSMILSSLQSHLPDVDFYLKEATKEWRAIGVVDLTHTKLRVGSLHNISPELTYRFALSNQSSVQLAGSVRQSPSNVCVLCDTKFSIFAFKYNCSMCDISVCDACSRQRVVVKERNRDVNTKVKDEELRCCDGCFNICRHIASITPVPTSKPIHTADLYEHNGTGVTVRPRDQKAVKSDYTRGNHRATSGARLRTTSESNSNTSSSPSKFEATKMSLFGRFTSSPTQDGDGANYDSGLRTRAHSAQSGDIDALKGTMAETRAALLERGEKLSETQDKTAEMANQANAFAAMARELKNSKKSFWGW